MSGITLIVISALMHSMWNLFLKKSTDKHKFNYQMHLLNLSLFTTSYPIFFKKYLYFDLVAVLFGLFAGIFFSAYHLFLSLSYKTEDVSKVYPITTSSPIFVTVLAVFILGEKITFIGFSGIIAVIFGILVLNSTAIKNLYFTKGVLFALLASIMYSFGAIIEKTGVGKGNIFLYIYSVTFFMTLFLFLYSKNSSSGHLTYFINNIKYLFPASIVLYFSVLTYRFGLETVNVSYATSIRQINALFGVILGAIFLKEKDTGRRLLASMIIILGIFFIKLGM
ncbi:MAG: DMT family transporter [Calditerrivibrio sp.]|nr:DMT family transporter [Calditerrivibrio sp.]